MQSNAEAQRQKWMRAACWGVCIGLALLEVWSGQQYSDPDGFSYLDMSDVFLRHNWHLLINPYWGALYPFLIGVATWLIRPSAYWELPVVHVVNFFIFLGALASFEFLLRQVISVLGQENGGEEANSPRLLPVWVWQLLGYSLFAWSNFVMVNGIRKVSPDLLVATFVYLDAGLLLRLRAGSRKSLTFLLLGLTLGLGYVTKAIMFPIAFVFLAVAFFAAGGRRKAVLPLSLTLLVFVAVAAPMFAGISRMVGRPSFGESGRMAYAWFIDGEEVLPFYSTSPAPYLKHPINLIHKDPNVFEFGQPFRVSYPLWFDPPYWNAGIKARIKVWGQLRVIGESLVGFYSFLVMPMGGLIGGWFILFLMSPNLPQRLKNIVKSWQLLIPGAAALGLYTLVLLQPRYIAPFVVLIWLGLFSAIRLQNSRESARLGAIATLVISASMMVLTAEYIVYHLVAPLPILQGHGGMYYQVAESLNREGVRQGEAVAIIGSGFDGMYWARLARVRIVAQITLDDADGFLRATDPRVKAEVFAAFARTGAKAVVAEMTPPPGSGTDWHRLGKTQHYVHLLTQP